MRFPAPVNALLSTALIACSIVGYGRPQSAEIQPPLPPPLQGKTVPVIGPRIGPSLSEAVPLAPNPVPSPVKQGPRLSFEEETFDFGKANPGTTLRHEFKVTNAGDELLEITAVRPSCGCTTAGEWPRQLKPGESGEIPIQIDTARLGKGAVSKSVYITSNDPKQPTAFLHIKGIVWTPVQMTPSYAVFPALHSAKDVAAKSIRITNQTEEPLSLSEVTSSSDRFRPELKTLRPGQEYELIIHTAPPLEMGGNRATVSMKTSSKEMPVISLSVFATVLPAVQVVPSQILLPSGRLNATMRRYVTVIGHQGDLRVEDVSAVADSVGVSFLESQPGKHFRITLEFPIGFEVPSEGQLALSFKTNHPDYPRITVPVESIAAVR